MKFVYPYMLVAVLLVPLACFFWMFLRVRSEKRLRAINSSPLALRPRLLDRFQMPLMLVGLLLMAFAASRPQWGKSTQVAESKSRNVVVALDVSRSMLAEDVRPNRLERAKADIADLMDSLEGDRCALVAFRRTGVLLCPLTSDYAFLRAALENASPESAPRGETDIGSAIRASLDALDPAMDDHNAIILISDGGDLRGNAIEFAQNARKRNVPIFTVGLGDSKKESKLPDASGTGTMKYQNAEVKVKLEDATLSAIAKVSGGRYVPLATAGTAETTLGSIYRRFLRQVAAKEQAEEEELRATERFHWFLIPGLVLVLMAAMCSRGRFAGRTKRVAAALVAGLLSVSLMAEGSDGGNGRDASAMRPQNAQNEAEDLAKQLISSPIVPQPVQQGVAEESAAEGQDPAQTPAEQPAQEAAYEPPPDLSDSEIWNIGYDFWKEGNNTNALSTLRPLMLSRTHGARAAELVGAMTEDPEERAAAMQIALRGDPGDARRNRNFTRAIDRLPEIREEKHIEEVMKRLGQQSPDQLLGSATKDARAILAESRSVLTNEAHVAIAKSEALAKRTEKLADVWIPVKQFVAQSVTNEQQAAVIVGDIEAARDATKKAADELADMEIGSDENVGVAENALTRFWKLVVMPPGAVDEDIQCQTNAVTGAAEIGGRPWQGEALDFTRAFRAKFPMWAQQYEQQAQSDTNKPPFTKEQQNEISALATEVEKLQIELAEGKVEEKDRDAKRFDALAKLERIRELLPKDKNSQNQQNQQDQQQQQQNQDKQQQDNNDDKQDQQQNQDQQDQQQDQQQEQKEDKKDEKEQQRDATDEEVEAMMKKAEERNDEHEREKRARMKKMPLPPNERDW